MKLLQLELKNFRFYRHLVLPLDSPRALLLGENGEGKSTIVDAIAYALTGRCRGVNDRGEGQRDLIRTGADEAVVKLTIAGMDPITRIITTKGTSCSHPADTLLTGLGTSKPMVTAAIYGSMFFDLERSEAQHLLMDLLNVQISVPGKDGGEDFLTLPDIDARYKLEYERRPGLKRALQALPLFDVERPASLEGQDIDPDSLDASLADAQRNYEAAVEVTASIRARGQQLREKKRKLEAAAKDPAGLQGSRDAHEETLANALAKLKAATADLEQLQLTPGKAAGKAAASEITDLEAFVRQATVVHLGDLSDQRPCILGHGIPCLTPAAQFTEVLTETKKKIAALKKAQAASDKRLAALVTAQQNVRNAQTEADYHMNQIATIDQAMAAENVRAIELRAVVDELADIEPDLVQGDAAIERAKSTLDRVQRLAVDYKEWIRAKEAQVHVAARRSEIQAELDECERLVDLYGPKGARSKALESALADFHQAVNAALKPFGFELAINVDPWRVMVLHPKTTQPLRYQLLSKGERTWTGLAFQMALAIISGLNFCVIDDAEGVVGQAMQTMTGLVMVSPVKQVLVIKAQAENQPVPQVSGLRVVRITKGTAELAAAVA
jgi:DNA repair ATPase RecN